MTTGRSMTRRTFVEQTAAAAAIPLLATATTAPAAEAQPKAAANIPAGRKLRIGIVGLGGRGSWIANLFKQHPGYEIVAAVDYFEDTADKVGDKLGVPAGKRFSGLAGYKRALDSGVDALVPTIENLFRRAWYSHVSLSGDLLLLYDIHIIDGITWVTGKRAVAASGYSRTVRPDPHGDRTDCGGVVFQLADGTCWTHTTQLMQNNAVMYNLEADLMGLKATAHIAYWGKVFVRGGPKHFAGETSSGIYADGAKANIAEFYRCVTEGDFDNPTPHRSVDCHLTAILGREAMARKTRLTMDELIEENKKLEVDLRGLKI